MVCLTSGANPLQARVWQEALEDEGIVCQIRGLYEDFGVGDTSGFHVTVWVKTADQGRAEAVLRE
ncbi:hypothetical protein PX52LOC_06969 [Limnoglobus roseus]|uniref:DUF2007 domain-containing protein n=2 Tax=Limnoglobus roseus TaxID=2598579 RepID=A0A5C1AP09_9BACT|nr:hypothetical protein PX52LOC_06969 [Limnoglobus roseus]